MEICKNMQDSDPCDISHFIKYIVVSRNRFPDPPSSGKGETENKFLKIHLIIPFTLYNPRVAYFSVMSFYKFKRTHLVIQLLISKMGFKGLKQMFKSSHVKFPEFVNDYRCTIKALKIIFCYYIILSGSKISMWHKRLFRCNTEQEMYFSTLYR